MDTDCLQVIASYLTAAGTVAVAVLAIWGGWFRDHFAPVRVTFSLRDTTASFTHLSDQEKTRVAFWHIEVENRLRWNPPRNIRLLITALERRGPDGAFHPLALPVRVQLRWSPAEFHELSPTVVKHDTCDLGSIRHGALCFEPSLYARPNNFEGFVHAGEALRYTVSAYADNYVSFAPLVVEVAWDGAWGDDVVEMGRHLVVKQVKAGH